MPYSHSPLLSWVLEVIADSILIPTETLLKVYGSGFQVGVNGSPMVYEEAILALFFKLKTTVRSG